MAKIKAEDIKYVRAKFFHNAETGTVYPVAWDVRMRKEVRTFESYGKNANNFPYPIEKLPKAVQAFLETAVAGMPLKNWPMELVTYTDPTAVG